LTSEAISNVRTVQLSAKRIAWLRYVVFVLTARVLARRAEPPRDVAAQAGSAVYTAHRERLRARLSA